MSEWGALLNGVYLSGGPATQWQNLLGLIACSGQAQDRVNGAAGCLATAPDGLGPPPRRTEDVEYPQRNGVRQFNDYYEQRIVTFAEVMVCSDGCPGCKPANDRTSARQHVRDISIAWSKDDACDSNGNPTELVLFTDCHEFDLQDNVYAYGTFDLTDDDWLGDGATVARVTDPVYEGDGALEITWGVGVAGAETAFGPMQLGTPQARYAVSAWLRADEDEPAIQLGVSDINGDDAVLSDAIVADGTWQYVQLDYIVPDNAEIMPFVSLASDAPSGGIGYVDSVLIQQYNNVDRTLNGPFGIPGKPRVSDVDWLQGSKCAQMTLRWDAPDQKIYVLDECGTPGYSNCVDITPGAQLHTQCFEDGTGDQAGQKVLCFVGGLSCFTTASGGDSVEPTDVTVGGTECVFPTITFYPGLTDPRVDNLTTGDSIKYRGKVSDYPVVVNTEDGSASQNGVSVTHLLGGSLVFGMSPGDYSLRALSQSSYDDGYAEVCWRDTVVQI